MSQEIFERYEKKYMVTRPQYETLCHELEGKMTLDEFGRHTISNIYFDTEDYELIRTSIGKPAYKEKLRLRAYGEVKGDSIVFLELKKKCGGIVYKRRVSMRLEEARKYLYQGVYPESDSQILREIDYTVKRYKLRAGAGVAYDRAAYYGNEDNALRLTFDENIRCRASELDLEYGPHGTPILAPDTVLMEVKIPGAMPLWMSRILSQLSIYPVSYSKYGAYYQEYLRRDLEYSLKLFIAKGGKICA